MTNKMGVFYLVAHLLITLAIIGGYLFSLHTGHPDETFKACLFTIIGYWFGAIGLDKIKNKSNKTGGNNNE